MHTHYLRKISVISLNILFISLFLFPVINTVYAQGGIGGNGGGTIGETTVKLENPLKTGTNTVVDFVALVLTSIVLPLGAVLATLAIIYSGFLLVMARGNDKELPKAKRAFLYSVIGTGIILGAWGIATAVQNTINQITQ